MLSSVGGAGEPVVFVRALQPAEALGLKRLPGGRPVAGLPGLNGKAP